MLDTVSQVTTPELITLKLRPAGLLPRAIAYLLDFCIQIGFFIITAIVVSWLGGFGMAVLFLVAFFLLWLYPVVFEVLNRGATPGKKILGLMVIQDDGTPITWGPSFLRNLLLVADFLPAMYAAGMLSMLSDKSFRRLGDRVAGTLVCYKPTTAVVIKIDTVEPIIPTDVLSRDEQLALINFAERAPKLNHLRQEELAHIIQDIASPKDIPNGEQGAKRLIGIANHLIGR